MAVPGDKPRSQGHDSQGCHELKGRQLEENEKRERRAGERRKSVVCAGLRCAKVALGMDIQINAQPVCDKTQTQA